MAGQDVLSYGIMCLISSPLISYGSSKGFGTGAGSLACVISPLANYKARTKPIVFMGFKPV